MKEKKYKFPEAATILLFVLLVVTALTWVIPRVSYETNIDSVTGILAIDEKSANYLPPAKTSFIDIPYTIVSAVQETLSILILLSVSNGMTEVLLRTGVIDALVKKMCRAFSNRREILLVLLMLGFSAMSLAVPPHCFVSFTPMVVSLMSQLGFSPLVGLSVIFLGVTVPAMTAPLGAVTVICQELAGLPAYSGIGVRFANTAVFLAVTILYILHYARKNARPVSAETKEHGSVQAAALGPKGIAGLGVLALVFAWITFRGASGGISIDEISGLFLAYTIVCVPLFRRSPGEVLGDFTCGVGKMAGICIVLVLASAVNTVLKESGLIHLMIWALSRALQFVPAVLIPAAILLFVMLMNAVLPSGPAKGVLLMPLLAPFGQMYGVTSQTTIVAYNFGDSISNYILPYDSTNVMYLSAAGIGFDEWVKFNWRLILIWTAAAILDLTVLYLTGYGL